MSRIKNLYYNENARTDILEAIRVLKKYNLFDILVWGSVPGTGKGFNTGDSEPLALAASWAMGFKDALLSISDPFRGLTTKKGDKDE